MMSSLSISYTVCEVLVAIVAAVGNTLVCVVFFTDRRLRKRTNYYIISLALADLLVGLFGIPVAILASMGLPKQLQACLASISVLLILCTVSILSLLAVSFDRFLAIMFPLHYSRMMSRHKAVGIIVSCWLIGSFIGLLPVMGWNAGPHPYCLFTRVMDYDYLLFLYFATIIFPGLLMATFYVRIYMVVVRQVRTMSFLSCLPEDATKRRSRSIYGGQISGKEVKAAKNLSVIVLFFLVCWFPLYTINCVHAFCPHCYIPLKLTNFTIVLSHANSALNPLLYAYNLRDFRRALYALVCVRLLRLKSVHETPVWFRVKVAAERQKELQHGGACSEPVRPRTRSEPPFRPGRHVTCQVKVSVHPLVPLNETSGVDLVESRRFGVDNPLFRSKRYRSCGHLVQLDDTSWRHTDVSTSHVFFHRERLQSS